MSSTAYKNNFTGTLRKDLMIKNGYWGRMMNSIQNVYILKTSICLVFVFQNNVTFVASPAQYTHSPGRIKNAYEAFGKMMISL